MTKFWTVLVTASLATLLTFLVPATVARADIYEWEFINPANLGLGKQPSATLALDGAGANAVPGADLSNRNLPQAYLIGANLIGANLTNTKLAGYENYQSADLTGANLSQANLTNAHFQSAHLLGGEYNHANGANLTNADLSQANLTNANFSGEFVLYEDTGYIVPGADLTGANLSGAQSLGASFTYATLTDANLAGAEVRGAGFSYSGITAAQLYSTASYQAHDLTGIDLSYNDLTGVILAGQNLTNAGFYQSSLANANLSQANLTNAGFYRAYLDNANLAQANLTNANFQYARLISANLSHVNLTGAKFSQNSYDYDNLFAYSSALLIGANLSHANLTNADFSGWKYSESSIFYGANLTNANLSGADARGANFYLATLTGANTSNLIQSDGHIAGLDLTAGASLGVRDYDGNPTVYATPTGPLPIVVDQHLAMEATGALRLVFDADPWDSTISFAPGIPVALGGTLDLTFAPGVNIATQSGRTIDLFDWTGVAPTGTFTVSSPYAWNLSHLYTTGEVTLAAAPSFPGDFNHDGTIDAADYVVWRKNPGGIYTQNDFNFWRAHFGQTTGSGSLSNATVPEPASSLLLALGAAVGFWRRRRFASRVRTTR